MFCYIKISTTVQNISISVLICPGQLIKNNFIGFLSFQKRDKIKLIVRAFSQFDFWKKNVPIFYCFQQKNSKTSILEYQLVSGKRHSRIEYHSKIEVIYFIKINFGLQQNPFQNRGYSRNLDSRIEGLL